MKIDVTTGDVITPGAIDYSFKTMFDDGEIEIRTYNLETIIAEKYETIIRRNIATTRARDFSEDFVQEIFDGRVRRLASRNRRTKK